MSLADSGFARFMSTPTGRGVRIIAGILLIVWGVMNIRTRAGQIVCVVGLVPLIAGAWDVCLFSGLFGGIWSGKHIRARKASQG
jgi:hypothetical protein